MGGVNGLDIPPQEPPRDVLAAEEFALPAPDPLLRPEHLVLPPDLVGVEPRDVLVAEEFAIPAPGEAHELPPVGTAGASRSGRTVGIAMTVVLALWAWRRREARQGRRSAVWLRLFRRTRRSFRSPESSSAAATTPPSVW